jgi:hypothetical protein
MNSLKTGLIFQRDADYIKALSIISKKADNYDIKLLLDDVINHPLVINNLLYKNLSFMYKNQFSIPNKKIPDIFYSSSSTIIKHPSFEDRYILNIRCVNYKLNLHGDSSIVSKNDICFTSNCIIVLNSNFDIIYKNIYHPQICDIPYIGIEDIRLFNFNKKIYYIGSSYDKTNGKVRISSAEYTMHENYKLNFITPTFDTDYNWEKNWVFFENNNEMFVIYKWSPIYICKIDYSNNTLNLIKKITSPDVFNNFRGSTNGVLFDNKIWFIVHSQININNKKHYYHRFVVLNTNLTLYGYSKMFKFENYLVEFCIGLELSFRNNFIITYSTLDSKTKLIVLPYNKVQNLLTNNTPS